MLVGLFSLLDKEKVEDFENEILRFEFIDSKDFEFLFVVLFALLIVL